MPSSRVRTRKTIVGSAGRRYACIPDISECPRWVLSSVYFDSFLYEAMLNTT